MHSGMNPNGDLTKTGQISTLIPHNKSMGMAVEEGDLLLSYA